MKKTLLTILLLALTSPVFAGTLTTNKLIKYAGGQATADSQVFDNGTNVGIASTSPTAKLDVNGTVKATTFSGSGASIVNIPSAGINWQDVSGAQLQTAGINWQSVVNSEIYSAGINWSDATTGGLPTTGINWSSVVNSELKSSGINWQDFPNNSETTIDFGNANIVTNGTISSGSTGDTTISGNLNVVSNINGLSSLIIAGQSTLGTMSTSGQATFGGNVGIGTTTPSANLEVSGDNTLTGINAKFTDSLHTTKVVILDNGNVGIGTTAPSKPLEVNGQVKGTGFTGIFYTDTNSYITSEGTNKIGLVTNGSEKVRIDASGNVGIGSTTPVNKFVIGGTGSFMQQNSADGTCWKCAPANSTGVYTCSGC